MVDYWESVGSVLRRRVDRNMSNVPNLDTFEKSVLYKLSVILKQWGQIVPRKESNTFHLYSIGVRLKINKGTLCTLVESKDTR